MCHITNLTKMCNSVTVTLKEEHLVNADIKIPQHSLVTFKFLTKFLAFFSSISAGKRKLQNERHSSVLNPSVRHVREFC